MRHILDNIQRNGKSYIMPLAMILGVILYRPITVIEESTSGIIIPLFISLTLFISLCRVEVRDMKLTKLHISMLLIQIVLSIAIYLALAPINVILAQGALVCILTPMAMSAVYIGALLGANITSLATYSLLNNLTIAIIAPVILAYAGDGGCSFTHIIVRITPLLVLPFVCAQIVRFATPKISKWISNHNYLSFVFWIISLMIIMGRTTAYVLELGDDNIMIEVVLAIMALVICILQFRLGRWLGGRYGEQVMGGQAIGQKNTLLAVWMAQSFLHPIASIAPTAYIVWQNIANSYQIYKKEQLSKK